MQRSLQARATLGLVLACALLVGACRDAKQESGGEQAPITAQPTKAQTTRAQLVASLLDPALSSLTPEAALERFAALDLQREQPLPHGLALLGRTADGSVKIGYVRNQDEQWEFTHLMLRIPAGTPAEAKAIYDELVKAVRERLGAPKRTNADGNYAAQTFRLSERLDVNVGAVLTLDEGEYYAALTATLVN